jgi:hypothetical protein
MSTINQVWGSGGSYREAKDFICGIECEVESSKNGGKHFGNFKCIQDGSLRNNGFEYVTLTPTTRDVIVSGFKDLHEWLKFGPDPFSERTSTHVHINVASLDEAQVKNMLMLYALFEELFFAMVKPARRHNIHCVPLTETHLPMHYHLSLRGLVERWHKYTGVNLGRIHDLGTVEFRHLHGTGDKKELDIWLHVLENLWKLCQRVDVNATTLSNKEMITEWFEAIFFPADKVMMLRPSLFDIIRNSLIDVKFSVAAQ